MRLIRAVALRVLVQPGEDSGAENPKPASDGITR
jgi:hypothetical protein